MLAAMLAAMLAPSGNEMSGKTEQSNGATATNQLQRTNRNEPIQAGVSEGEGRVVEETHEATQTEMGELAAVDLAEFFGENGPLAAVLEHYELRDSQLQMTQAVQRALLSQTHALIEAPTGTGKSLAYLLPAILSGQTVVIATANKSLQNQLYTKEIPFLERVLQRSIPTVVVKGRSNFICNYKWEKELAEQRTIAMYDREDDQVRGIRTWLENTTTGDIDDLPFVVSNDLRPRVVSFTDDCLQRDCRFYLDECWVNRMRDMAGEAQVIITNHHLLLNALAFGEAGERILPAAPIYVIDEAHQLEQTATAVYETSVTDYTVEQLLARGIIREHVSDEELDELRFLNTMAFQEAANQSRDNSSYALEGELEQMLRLANQLRELSNRLKRENPYGQQGAERNGNGSSDNTNGDSDASETRRMYELAIEALASTAEKLTTVAQEGKPGEMVRYASRVFDRRRVSLELHAAPIDASGLLAEFLFHPDREGDGTQARTVICTSATLATGGHFSHFKQRCGIMEVGEELVLPPVFNYPEQAMLYQPPLPTFNGRNADAYYDAVAQEIERLLEVSRGRALCLFTSWSGLQVVSDRLNGLDRSVVWPLRAQGDAPRNALLAWFMATPHSVLLATRSFWEGVDIPGEHLSLVVVDKLPFPTPGDPLHAARMQTIDDDGRSSFGDYMLPLMTLTLKQGFGRLIRRSSDRGVVAILDERLTGKSYGRRTQRDLPPAPLSRNFRDVERFFQKDRARTAHFALNVWAQTGATLGEYRWRWQLVRLNDGRSDAEEGEVQTDSPVVAELAAVLSALENLQARIRAADRQPAEFGVEVRCAPDTAARVQTDSIDITLPGLADWREATQAWREIVWLPVEQNSEPDLDTP